MWRTRDGYLTGKPVVEIRVSKYQLFQQIRLCFEVNDLGNELLKQLNCGGDYNYLVNTYYIT